MSDKPRLQFRRALPLSEFRKAVKDAADQLLQECYRDIRSTMKTREGTADLHLMTEDEENYFRRMVEGGAYAIMDSYGTGSKMDTKYNAALDDYKRSGLYNPARHGKQIVGRPAGEYTNIFGETEVSTGKREGKSVESFYPPQSPSYAFQRAEIWFFKGQNNRVKEVITKHIGRFIGRLGDFTEYR